MRTSGHLLVGAGTLGGVLAAAPTPESTIGFAVSALVLAAGLLLSRAKRPSAPAAGVAPPAVPSDDLAQALEDTRRLAADAGTLPLGEIRERIDGITTGPLFRILRSLDARPAGDPRVALFAARLATVERRLNRSWSAAVDGAREELLSLLPQAADALAAAAADQEGRAAKH